MSAPSACIGTIEITSSQSGIRGLFLRKLHGRAGGGVAALGNAIGGDGFGESVGAIGFLSDSSI